MSRITATPLVQLAMPSGVEMNAYLVLDEKPTRQQMKLNTVSQYVQKHPTGWKKRLELAELLYTMPPACYPYNGHTPAAATAPAPAPEPAPTTN